MMTDGTVHNLQRNVPTPAEAKRGCLGLNVEVTMSGADYIFEGVLEHFMAGEASILLDHSFLRRRRFEWSLMGFGLMGKYCSANAKGAIRHPRRYSRRR